MLRKKKELPQRERRLYTHDSEMLLFHRKCGDRVSLVNGQCTAVRDVTEFNFGLVFSAEPLKDDEVFQVRIDKKVSYFWSDIVFAANMLLEFVFLWSMGHSATER